MLAIIIVVTVVKEDQLDCPAHAGRFTMVICACGFEQATNSSDNNSKKLVK